MFKNISQWLFIAILVAFIGCAALGVQQKAELRPIDELSVLELVKRLPADDNIESSLIFQAILQRKTEGILKICQQLNSREKADIVAAHYALDGLAHFVSQPGISLELDYYSTALEQTLAGKLAVEQKAFLLSMLQSCARSSSIPVVSSFLTHPLLNDPATRTLITIGGDAAGNALFSALPRAKGRNKIDIIQALGELRWQSAAEALMKCAEEASLKAASLSALARIGYLPAGSLINQAGQQDAQFTADYLVFARQVGETGHPEKMNAICQQIFQNEKGHFTSQSQLAALSLLVEKNGVGALLPIVPNFPQKDKKTRKAILRMAGDVKDSVLVQKWIEVIKIAEPEVQAEIITLLGQQSARQAVPLLLKKLKTGTGETKAAAIAAITKVLAEKAGPHLIEVLQDTTNANERNAVKQALLRLPDSAFVPAVRQYFTGLPAVSKIILIEVLDQRNIQETLPLVLGQIDSPDKDLRNAALKALKNFAGDAELPTLISHLAQAEKSAEIRATQNAIAAVVQKVRDKKAAHQSLIQAYDDFTAPEKIKMFPVFKKLGGRRWLQFVLKAMENNELRDKAIRTLVEWPDVSALEALIVLAQSKAEEKYRILAIRGALQILRENKMGEQRALELYQQLMQAAERAEEKRNILASLAQVKTKPAIKYAAQFLDNESLNYEAALAITQMANPNDEVQEALTSEQVALALIEAGADQALQEKLTADPIIKPRHNQPPEGFIALFNGKDLTNWKGLVANPVKRAHKSAEELAQEQAQADSSMREHWKALDGVLYFDGKGHSLCTVKDYADFELYVDWKIEKHGDSGIYLRGTPQVQIWDTAQWPEGSGGLYNNQKNPRKPLQAADNPIGNWNTFHIIMRAERVTVYLNDVLVVDNTVLENYWERDKPIYPKEQIELQSHNSPLYFRNIFIRELPEEEPAFAGALFNGKDLTGWEIVGGTQGSWVAENGILSTVGGGGWISTTREFGDFKLELEFRVPRGGNSGVFIRAPREGNPAFAGMEIQVLDDYAEKYAKLKPWQYTGSIYAVQAPKTRATKQATEWQKMEIVCQGTKVKVTLNAIRIIQANLIDYLHKETSNPGIKRRKGFIGLQNHNTKIEYRNIQLVEFR